LLVASGMAQKEYFLTLPCHFVLFPFAFHFHFLFFLALPFFV
jgi:hypothetical protein